jgi:STE20-related kinase adapter protein alpha
MPFGYDISEYWLKAELSKCLGGQAVVYFAQHRESKKYLAVKKYKVDNLSDFERMVQDEIVTLRQFHHPNILNLHTVFVSNFEINIIMDLFCYGSAKDTMTNYFVTGIPEILCALILKDILLGLDYLHRKEYVHRSIRASHILLNQTKAVLSGFRDAKECRKNLHELPQNSAAGLNWLAPEVLEQNLIGYSLKSDVYSVGITTCELANAIAPFAGLPTTLMLTEKIRGNKPNLLDYSTCPSDEMIGEYPLKIY